MPRNIAYVPTGVMRINATTECALLVDSARFSRARWHRLSACLSHIREPDNTRLDDRWDHTVVPYSKKQFLLIKKEKSTRMPFLNRYNELCMKNTYF